MSTNPNSIHFDDCNGVALGAYYSIVKIAEIHSFNVPVAELVHLAQTLSAESKTNFNQLISNVDRCIVNVSNFIRQDTRSILGDLVYHGGWKNFTTNAKLTPEGFQFVEFKTIRNTSVVIMLNLQNQKGKYNTPEWTPVGVFSPSTMELFEWSIFMQLDLRIQAGIHENQ